MKKKIILLSTLILIFINICCIKVYAKQEFISLNPIIEVGEKIYVQHDENNNDIYDLKNLERELQQFMKEF